MAKQRRAWTELRLRAERRAIKTELDAAEVKGGPEARIALINRRLRQLEEAVDEASVLKRYTYVMSALVYAQRHGGISRAHVRRLVEMAYAVLQVQGVKPLTSRQSSLYADAHLVLSQIHRKAGRTWESLWEQRLSALLARAPQASASGAQVLASAIRALRRGNAGFAVTAYGVSVDLRLTPEQRELALLGRVKALRLAGDLDAAAAQAEALAAEGGLSPQAQAELAWEAGCRAAARSGDVGGLVAAVRKGSSLRTGDYALEAALWCHAAKQRARQQRLPPVPSLARELGIRVREHGAFYRSALLFDRLQDAEVPFVARMKDLGRVLADTERLLTVDKEMLVWAAAARWLYRNGQFGTARLALDEYVALCLRLSAGKSRDTLGLVADADQALAAVEPRRLLLGKASRSDASGGGA